MDGKRPNKILQVTGQIFIVTLITFVLLEVVTWIVWWNNATVTVLGKQITLLPYEVVSAEQLQTLQAWSKNPNSYIQFDPVLGWTHRPGVSEQLEGVTYTANSVGARALREYVLEPPANIIRLAAFGPSFVHSDEVGDSQTWAAQLEQARSELEVMNWGVGGYGTDQAYLRYKTQGAAFQPRIVIIGFEEENIYRNVNRFRPFYRPGTGLPLTKPLFITITTGLTMLENPYDDVDQFYQMLTEQPEQFLNEVCPYDYFCDATRYQARPLDVFASYRLWRTLLFEMSHNQSIEDDPESYQDSYPAQMTLRLVSQFVEDVAKNGAIPLVLVFPEQSTIADYEAGLEPVYQTGVTALRDQGVQVIDLAGAFVEAKQTQNRPYEDFYASEGGHFNELGNYVVAQAVLWHLCGQGMLHDC